MADDPKTLYHGMKPFTNKRLTWGEDALRRKCRLTPKATTGNVCSFETKLLVLEGNEKPELFILWLTEFNEKVFSQVQLSASSKYTALLEMVQNNALTVCRSAYIMASTVNDDVNLMFTTVPIKFKLQAMSQSQWENYLLGEDYQHDIVRECITQIGAKIFGKDHAGSNAYIHLRRQIREMRVSLQLGIRKYEERLNDYQKYLPFCPWVSGEKLGKLKVPYDEQELKEILETAILDSQQVKLNHNKWVIQDNTVESTIDELHGYEPILLKEAAAEKRIAVIEGKNGIITKTKKRGRGGGGGGGGGGVVKTRPKCDNCGKHHNGVCTAPTKKAFADRLDKSGKPNWSKKEKLYITQHIAQKVSEATADGSDSEEEEDRRKKRKSKWSKGLDSGEKMFCMALAQEDGYSDVDEADDDEIRDYKKKARRTAKQLKRS